MAVSRHQIANHANSALNYDLICPISRREMRHPVNTSNGQRFELIELYKWVVIGRHHSCPVTRLKLSNVELDVALSKLIDQSELSDRYEDYAVGNMINQINQVLAKAQENKLSRIDWSNRFAIFRPVLRQVHDFSNVAGAAMMLSLFLYVAEIGRQEYKDDQSSIVPIMFGTFGVAMSSMFAMMLVIELDHYIAYKRGTEPHLSPMMM